jgi:hypothetical protein
VFERINSGGIRLSPQEIRNCINDGALLSAIRKMNDDVNWRAIFGEKRNNRLKDQELILRFLAMISRPEKYSRPMRDFLNEFTAEAGKDQKELDNLESLFRSSVRICNEAKGKEAFRPSRALNAAVFEAVMVGVAKRLSENAAAPDIAKVVAAYDSLLDDKSFMRVCERATADEESVKTRQKLAINAFKSV